MLEQTLVPEIFAVLLVFCRMGSAVMLLPGFGEAYVSIRARLMLALMLSLVVAQVVKTQLPPLPNSALSLTVLVVAEIIVGLFIGSVSRIIISTMHAAGVIIAMQSSLGTAALFDTTQNTQGSSIGNFITLFAILLIFALDMHHLMLRGLSDSYTLFLPGQFPPIGDITEYIGRLVDGTFTVAVQIAAPQIVVGLSLYIGAGVLSRLMPQMQVFFIMLPLQILLAFFVLMVTFSGMMLWYLSYYEETLQGFLYPS